MKYLLFTITLCIFSFMSIAQKTMTTPENATELFDSFKKKEKFIYEEGFYYPGIADEKFRPTFTEKINLAADDFKKVAESSKPSEEMYHAAIETGLARFTEVFFDLDTEDRERVCRYFEELMDIVGLESSGGRLNYFMYDFIPTQRN